MISSRTDWGASRNYGDCRRLKPQLCQMHIGIAGKRSPTDKAGALSYGINGGFSALTSLLTQTKSALLDDRPGGPPCRLSEDLDNDDCVCVDTVDDSPIATAITHSHFVTMRTTSRHSSSMRHSHFFAALQTTQQHARIQPRLATEWRRSDFAVQPDQRFAIARHRSFRKYRPNVI